MKYLMSVILLVMYSLTLNSTPTLHNSKPLLNAVLSLIAKDLGLDTSNISVYISNADVNKDLIDEFAATTELGNENYVISMKNNLFKEDIIKAFIHETVHVSQCYHKRLVIRREYVWWEGAIIRCNTPYYKRQYEVEAIQLTDELYWKYKKAMKELK